MSTRRHFLLNCTALALTVVVAPGLALADSLPIHDVALDQLSLAAFKASLQTSFKVSGTGVAANLLLVRVEEQVLKQAKPHFKDAKNEKFMLLFQGSLSGGIGQNTYSFESVKMGRFDIFITPVKCKDQDHCYYEAIFNRPPTEASKKTSSSTPSSLTLTHRAYV